MFLLLAFQTYGTFNIMEKNSKKEGGGLKLQLPPSTRTGLSKYANNLIGLMIKFAKSFSWELFNLKFCVYFIYLIL